MNDNNQEKAKHLAWFRHGSSSQANNRVRIANNVSNPSNVAALRSLEKKHDNVRQGNKSLRAFLGCALVFCILLLLGITTLFCFAFYEFHSKLGNRMNSSSNRISLSVAGTVAESYAMLGQYTPAVDIYESKLIPLIVQAHGPISVEVIQTRSRLGDLYQKAGNQLAYKQQYEIALGILNNLKSKTTESGDNAKQIIENEHIYKSIIELRTSFLGANSQQVAEDKLSLVQFYLSSNQWPKAKNMFEQIKRLQFWRQSKDLSVANVLQQLGEQYKNDHDLVQAEYLLAEAADVWQKLAGKHSYPLAIALGSVACTQVERGNYNKALETLDKARKALPDDGLESSKRLLMSLLEEQGWCYLGLTDFAAGKKCFQDVLALGKFFGNNDPDMARGLYGLAWIYHHQGELDKAERTYKEALKVVGKSDKGPLRTNIASALTDLYHERGKMKEAAALESQSTLMLQPVLTNLLLSENKSNKHASALTEKK